VIDTNNFFSQLLRERAKRESTMWKTKKPHIYKIPGGSWCALQHLLIDMSEHEIKAALTAIDHMNKFGRWPR